MKTQARVKLFFAYIVISMVVVSLFTLLFYIMDYTQAALIQSLALMPFAYALYQLKHKNLKTAKWVAILASIIIVVIQTNVVFTNATGFHVQLLALVVVAFLICDMKIKQERYLALMLASLIATSFFVSNYWQIYGPIIIISPSTERVFNTLSYTTTFIALSALLYLYSMQLAQKELELSILANTDALTNIYNRGFFMREGEIHYHTCQTKHKPLSVILFDIDDFKQVNDTYGHPIGDQVLVTIANSVRNITPPDSIFARYGGEEFALILPYKGLIEAWQLAEEIRKHIAHHTFHVEDHKIDITLSFGVASSNQKYREFDTLIRSADRALYHAKRHGKNQTITICDDAISKSTKPTIQCIL